MTKPAYDLPFTVERALEAVREALEGSQLFATESLIDALRAAPHLPSTSPASWDLVRALRNMGACELPDEVTYAWLHDHPSPCSLLTLAAHPHVVGARVVSDALDRTILGALTSLPSSARTLLARGFVTGELVLDRVLWSDARQLPPALARCRVELCDRIGATTSAWAAMAGLERTWEGTLGELAAAALALSSGADPTPLHPVPRRGREPSAMLFHCLLLHHDGPRPLALVRAAWQDATARADMEQLARLCAHVLPAELCKMVESTATSARVRSAYLAGPNPSPAIRYDLWGDDTRAVVRTARERGIISRRS